MVGASELPFRILCRTHGASLAYTPMISSKAFVASEEYRREALQTNERDRPLVVHFSANDVAEFGEACKLVENECDAIDLNLGCPQRTAYVGHYGSYLLDPVDRQLILSMVAGAVRSVSVPIFVKIRLLDDIEDTVELVTQLRDAGASMVAIHGRYRASFERNGAGARDGPAMLDQIAVVKRRLKDFPIVTNGNIITYQDAVDNVLFTNADGAMSAEGILDNPALYNPAYAGTKLDLCREYIELVKLYPATIRTIVFHTRRMLKDELNKYQMMSDVVQCKSLDELVALLNKLEGYMNNQDTFVYDSEKANLEKIAKERRAFEEGKRKAYEQRMIRKAKREGKEDREFYLRKGTELPTRETIEALKICTREQQLSIWNDNHSQHCLSYHLDEGGCKRDRKCAFLHSDIGGFVEKEEVAG
jgi:tRNA-dihydrouridine synthase 1